MVLVQKWPFFQLFFQAIQTRKMSFTIFYKENTSFQGIKTRSSNSRKFDIFPTGLTHGFGPKLAIFPNFVFTQCSPGKCPLRYSTTKKGFLGYKNKKFKKSKNCSFSKVVNPWFWFKNGHFANFFFLANVAQGNVLYDILERKNAFLGYKNKKLKSRKIDIFPKGLTHGFGPKMAIFPTFFFSQCSPGKCLSRYSKNKKRVSSL